MSLNLAGVQAMVEEQFLDDTVDAFPAAWGAKASSVLDRTTGLMVPAPLPAPVWSGDAALFPAGTTVGRVPFIDDQQVPDDGAYDYRMLYPLGADVLPGGTFVVPTTSLRDPALVGTAFRLTKHATMSTFAVCRIALLVLVGGPNDRPR